MKIVYRVVRVKNFEKSLQRLERSGKVDRDAIEDAIDLLATGNPLPPHLKDHALRGEYAGCRECHIRGDLLLVYARRDKALILILLNIGSHHELFGL